MSGQSRGISTSEAEKYILNAIRQLEFGSVTVTVHNAHVVQIEKSEKRRFGTQPK